MSQVGRISFTTNVVSARWWFKQLPPPTRWTATVERGKWGGVMRDMQGAAPPLMTATGGRRMEIIVLVLLVAFVLYLFDKAVQR